jgi:SAM-dependent methyltransferase
MVTTLNCPLCVSGKPESFLETCDFFLTKEKFILARCPSCGFILTQDPPGEEKIGRYYESEEYVSHDDSGKGISQHIYRRVRSLMLKRKRKIVNKLTGLTKGFLLDIGSGTGHFLSEMKRSGWDTKGIEVNRKARDFSVTKLVLDVLPPEALKSLPESAFDCITLWHVLEHFHDPFSYSSEIRRLLKPGGSCIIALPNSSSYDAIHYGRFWAAWDVPRHLWHFNPDTFRLFSKKTGFTLTGIKSLPFDVFYISSESERYKGTGFPFLTGMIKGAWFSAKAFFNKEKASSLIYFLRH